VTRPRRPAAFLDRDGTIIHDTGYVGKEASVSLVPGAGAAIRRLNEAGIPVVVVTNQSGIARGLFTMADYDDVRAHVDALLAEQGARLDGHYMCPHHPEVDGPCECRKPGLLLFRRAADEHALDLGRSVFIGDRWRDAAPATALGGLGLLVLAPSTPPGDADHARADGIAVVSSLGEAVDRFLAALPASNATQ
jgi:histidinol-phosphate phosphatase family protein